MTDDESIDEVFGPVILATRTGQCPICKTPLIEEIESPGFATLSCPKCFWMCGFSPEFVR